jgi:hypothetical protein
MLKLHSSMSCATEYRPFQTLYAQRPALGVGHRKLVETVAPDDHDMLAFGVVFGYLDSVILPFGRNAICVEEPNSASPLPFWPTPTEKDCYHL